MGGQTGQHAKDQRQQPCTQGEAKQYGKVPLIGKQEPALTHVLPTEGNRRIKLRRLRGAASDQLDKMFSQDVESDTDRRHFRR